jgi:uncharacterized membrane protein (UPF0127 family)
VTSSVNFRSTAGAFFTGGSRLLLPLLVLLSLSGALSCGKSPEPEFVTVRVGDAEIEAEVVYTPKERALGLGGRDSLAPDAGMLFVLPQEERASFWMKGMRIPLDFVWISGERGVSQVTADVRPPPAGTPTSSLKLYKPDQPVRYTLELNAGAAERLGITVGDTVTFEPEVDVNRAS